MLSCPLSIIFFHRHALTKILTLQDMQSHPFSNSQQAYIHHDMNFYGGFLEKISSRMF